MRLHRSACALPSEPDDASGDTCIVLMRALTARQHYKVGEGAQGSVRVKSSGSKDIVAY
jgi:hypothetical protein